VARRRGEDARPDPTTVTRIYLSPPDVGPTERALLLEAFDSNWIAPVGPFLDRLERELAPVVGVDHVAALSNGTAGLHLALHLLGVGPGDEVLVPTLTFVATANAVTYTGARPVFVDADPTSWCLDPDILAAGLAERARTGSLPAAIVTVDLYGRCADYDAIVTTADRYGIPVIEDAAEALGACYRGRPAGSFGRAAVLSFNGNKIATTSGGGALVSADQELIDRARHLATQARDPAPHYQHSEIGFNYRLSNLLAAVGVGQLQRLAGNIARRAAIEDRYRDALTSLPGVAMLAPPTDGSSNHWLSVLTIDAATFGATPEQVRVALEGDDIESRPLWKPLHLQPVYADHEVWGGDVAAALFRAGLCLPSGSNLAEHEQDRVIDIVRSCCQP
jgi:dTDP-4-amino-4,6-dideoxygalactose transaminase